MMTGKAPAFPACGFRKAGKTVASQTAVPTDFVNIVAAEMAHGVEIAVEHWLAQVELAMTDRHLTTLGRMNAVHEILQDYKRLTGKAQLKSTQI
jgi:hypothetical protein